MHRGDRSGGDNDADDDDYHSVSSARYPSSAANPCGRVGATTNDTNAARMLL